MIAREAVLANLDFRRFYSGYLPDIKANGSGQGSARCTFHDDHHASLSINLTDGTFFCHACQEKGSVFDFYMKRNNVDFKTAMEELGRGLAPQSKGKPQFEATYDYTDENGTLLYQVVRFEGKKFRVRRPDGDGWIWNLGDVGRVLYRLPEIVGSPSVVLVEGEKDANNLKEKFGLIATCNPGGAGKWRPEYTESLKSKRVVLFPDNDEPGRNHAQLVAQALHGTAQWVKVIHLPDLPPKGDVSDWISTGGSKEKLLRLIKSTPEWAPEERPELSGWEDPVPLDGITTPEIPAASLPGWLGEYAKAVSENAQTPEGLAVMMGLAAVATCAQGLFKVSPFGDGYSEPLNLWTCTALDPASRKTAVVNHMTGPLRAWEEGTGEALASQIADNTTQRTVFQKRIDKLTVNAANCENPTERENIMLEINILREQTPEELVEPRLWTGDCTGEQLQHLMEGNQGRMAILSDEGGQFEVMAGLYSGGRANRDIYLQGHAGGSVRIDRRGRAVFIHSASLTFGLAVQPDVLRDFSSPEKARFRGTGISARFLYCIPENNIGTRDIRKRHPIPEIVANNYKTGLLTLLSLLSLGSGNNNGPEERVLNLDTEALGQWEKFHLWLESRIGREGDLHPIQDWAGKLPGAALRIGGLFHLVEYGTEKGTINSQTMARALDLCELLIDHAKAAFGLMGADVATGDAKKIILWIKRKGQESFTLRECHREVMKNEPVLRVEQGLNIAVERNYISEPFKEDTGGRPKTRYMVNPVFIREVK